MDSGRDCHDAICKASEYLNAGCVWTVDLDLEQFFDTVNWSKDVEILPHTIKVGRIISLIHKFVRAGTVWCGRCEDTELGVPQGGPFSPLLANIVLNEPDHELEKRGHKFVWYADDMVIPSSWPIWQAGCADASVWCSGRSGNMIQKLAPLRPQPR